MTENQAIGRQVFDRLCDENNSPLESNDVLELLGAAQKSKHPEMRSTLERLVVEWAVFRRVCQFYGAPGSYHNGTVVDNFPDPDGFLWEFEDQGETARKVLGWDKTGEWAPACVARNLIIPDWPQSTFYARIPNQFAPELVHDLLEDLEAPECLPEENEEVTL